MTSSKLLACTMAVILVGLQGAAQPPHTSLSLFEAVEPHMGTLMRIKLYAPNASEAEQALRAAFDRIAQLDGTLSDYKPESELSRITQTAVKQPVPVSPDLFRILSVSQELSEASGGAFDITLGPVTHLWREARKAKRLPDEAALHDALRRCGYSKMHLDASRHTVTFDEPDMQLDAGGIAKGYAADEALTTIEKLGIHSALVAASGDLAFSNAPPGEKGWKVEVDSGGEANAPLTRALELSNAAISTSGDTEQHLDANGLRYSHIIDPKSGVGLTQHVTVTVIARHGIEADGTTKVVSVLGEAVGLSYVNRHPGLAALIVTGTDGRSRVSESPLFTTLMRASTMSSNKTSSRAKLRDSTTPHSSLIE